MFHATFPNHSYPLHSHESWAVLIVDSGAIRYDLDRRDRGADTRTVTVLPPFVAHDGESAHPGQGFRKRVVYLHRDLLGEHLIGHAVDESTLDDPLLRKEMSALHDSLDRPRDDLEQESRLAMAIDRIRRQLRNSPHPPARAERRAAWALRDYLDSRPFDRHHLAEVGFVLGWSHTHMIRSFSREFGIPPHRYLISRRLEEARRRLLAGQPPARVAVEVGFYDQAHLSRHFKTLLSTTPGRYQKSDG